MEQSVQTSEGKLFLTQNSIPNHTLQQYFQMCKVSNGLLNKNEGEKQERGSCEIGETQEQGRGTLPWMMVKGVLGWQRGGNQFRAEQPEGSVTDSCEEMKPID